MIHDSILGTIGRTPITDTDTTAFVVNQLSATSPRTAAVDAAHANVGPDTVAKLLFTSGSTGVPKIIPRFQRRH